MDQNFLQCPFRLVQIPLFWDPDLPVVLCGQKLFKVSEIYIFLAGKSVVRVFWGAKGGSSHEILAIFKALAFDSYASQSSGTNFIGFSVKN